MTTLHAFETETDFKSAIDIAKNAARAYYDEDHMLMADAEYDALIAQIEASVEVHPEWDHEGILDSVAAGVSAGGDVKHKEPMLSIAKAKESDELVKFMGKMGNPVTVEAKLDGLAVSAIYVKGVLTQVATRGDGNTGEDVTAQAKSINGLPAKLSKKVDIEVRGEVFMTDKDFEVSNHNRVAYGKRAFVNPRNGTAGALRKIDAEYTNQMSFASYGASGSIFDAVDSYIERMSILNGMGFQTTLKLTEHFLSIKAKSTSKAVIEAVEKIGANRATLGFPIDGAVIKVDSHAAREGLGSIGNTPRWAIAFKYPADTATTILRDIETDVGRTGHMSLRARIDPVFVGGSTVEYATLHNPQFVADADLRIGDTVYVYKAGDVIPRVNASDLSKRPSGTRPWEPLAECPSCGSAWDKSSKIWRCLTPECSVSGQLAYWATGEALDIDGIGDAVAEALVEANLASNVADLYDLTEAQWASLPMGTNAKGGVRLLGKSTAVKIMAGLEKSKKQPFNRVVTGLGIRKTGRTVGRWLAKEFKSMDALRSATVEQISEIDKMGAIKAQHVVDGLRELSSVIDRLAAHGLTMATEESGGEKILAGKTYVVSGSVPGYNRTTISERIEALGGTASSSVSARTTALITSETDTSKAKKAAELGIPVIDPAEFAKLIA